MTWYDLVLIPVALVVFAFVRVTIALWPSPTRLRRSKYHKRKGAL